MIHEFIQSVFGKWKKIMSFIKKYFSALFLSCSCFVFTFFLNGCSFQTPEAQMINLLQERYANLYVNGTNQKRAVIKSLETYLYDHRLNEQNLPEIKRILNKLNDGHVVIYEKNKSEDRVNHVLDFHYGSLLVHSCRSCRPVIPPGVYQISSYNGSLVNRLNPTDFTQASSPRGGEFRLIRSFKKGYVSLISGSGKKIQTELLSNDLNSVKSACVSGARINKKTYRIILQSLWCDHGIAENRKMVLQNFFTEWNNVLAGIKTNDKIILDLRENGGGGDEEVQYVINTFINKPVFLYSYQYLHTTHPGIGKWLEKILPFRLGVLRSVEADFTDNHLQPTRKFYVNKLTTLISTGCFSSCEVVASVLKLENRSILVGTTTHGGAGDPIAFSLKNTPYAINLPTCIVRQKDRKLYEGVGVDPDIFATKNRRSMKDEVLLAGLKTFDNHFIKNTIGLISAKRLQWNIAPTI
jgi:hypothetical protein